MPRSTLDLHPADGLAALIPAADGAWYRGFVTGPEHTLLIRAFEDLAAGIGSLYNPLVLHGACGVGKTHLALAWVDHHRAADRLYTADQRAIYLSGADWATGYADAVDSRSLPAWRDQHRSTDLLMIDGLEQLSDKTAAQIELLHTCDDLVANRQQVVVTARRAPARVTGLVPGLQSRLTAGLVLEIPHPSSSVRQQALRRMASERGIAIDNCAIDLLAAELRDTWPDLSGALHELRVAVGGNAKIEHTAVRAFLRSRKKGRGIALHDVARQTARHFGVTISELRGPSRRQQVALARGVAMHVARELTGKSLQAVGQYFGGRDHTTVMYACRKTDSLASSDPAMRDLIVELRSSLGTQ